MDRIRRTGYAYHGKGTPPLKEQEKALMDAECDVVFTDTAPSREDRDAMIDHALEAGDTVVICKTSIIGSGAKDTADMVRKICAKGCPIEVIGCGARLYTTEAEIRDFAALALKTSRSINARNMIDRRERAGPRGKLDSLTSEQWSTCKFLWFYPGVKQVVAVDYVNIECGVSATRVNIAQRIKAEMVAKSKEGQADG